mgnify:FL=1
MSKIKLNNSFANPLLDFLKTTGVKYNTHRKHNELSLQEVIFLYPKSKEQKEELLSILQNYGTSLYHNSTLQVDMNVVNIFNYSSDQYENVTTEATETELPLFYLENQNDQNNKHSAAKALSTNKITKNYIKNIANSQSFLNPRPAEQLNKMRNILFGNSFIKSRSTSQKNEFCYYNKIEIGSQGVNEIIGTFLRKVKFQQEMFGGFIADNQSVNVQFLVNNQEQTIPVQDVLDIINNNPLILDTSDKLILGSDKKTSSYITNNFKKFLLTSLLNNKKIELLKTFKQMHENEECSKEFIIYKIDKFLDTDTVAIQSFWMFEEEFKEFTDYQIKRDTTYRYEIKAYSVIYGTQSEVSNINELTDGSVSFDFTSNPSYKMAIVDFDTVSVKVAPKIPLPPYVVFLNESSSKNFVKIYLDLDNGSKKEKFIEITENDSILTENIETDPEGNIDFEYAAEEGKFEVFRLDEKPVSIRSFENAKILDVKNKIKSTSVVFKNNVLPNKKYYYMFRAVNFIGVPSNPSPVYEVELIKDAEKSKIISKTIMIEQKESIEDKNFKNLLQIIPAFQQQVFDEDSNVREFATFKKNINNLKLGVATDKVWGKKFKIRVKSKDTGKMIDLNVKFNLIKDNIK